MEKFQVTLEKFMLPIANKVTSVKILIAIKDAMITSMPFLIIGSLFLLIASFPIPGYSDFMLSIFGEGWDANLTIVTTATFGMVGFFLLVTIPYYYSRLCEEDALFPIIITLASYFVLTAVVDGKISIEWFGSQGMMFNILLATLLTKLYFILYHKNWGPKMPDGVPPGVTKSFTSLVPIFIILTLVLIVRLVFEMLGFESVQYVVYTILQFPLQLLGSTLPSLLVAEMVGQLLWFMGIHGNAIVNGIMDPVWLSLSAENLALTQDGLEPIYIINKQFKEIFLQIGGSGSTLPLAILLLTCKSKQLKAIGALALPASIFNINEPLIFGLPIVLNPMFFIPWMINTPIAAIVTYFSMSTGLVNVTSGLVIPWTTPVIISGFLVSGLSGSVLQVVLVLIGFLVYFPFLKIYDKSLLKEQNLNLKQESDIL